mgnify:CR=1 FL=1
MKKIVIRARQEDLSKVKDTLDNIDCIAHSQINMKDKEAILYVPEEMVENTISKLISAIDFRFKENMIEVSSLDFVIARNTKEISSESKPAKVIMPVEHLISSTRKYMRLDMGKILLTSIASLVTLIGLLLDNSAIVIGAMLLSPLLGPIYGFAINTAVGRLKDAVKSIGFLMALLLLAFSLSAFSARLLEMFYRPHITGEISLREMVNPIYVPMAILLGFASLVALTNGILESIVGVAVAVALLPPAVVSGFLVTIDMFRALAPTVIVLQNVLGLMSGSLIAILVLNIGPRKYYEKKTAKRYLLRMFYILLLLISIVSVLSILYRG